MRATCRKCGRHAGCDQRARDGLSLSRRTLDDQFSPAMMPDMPRTGHFGPDIRDGCGHFPVAAGAQRSHSDDVL